MKQLKPKNMATTLLLFAIGILLVIATLIAWYTSNQQAREVSMYRDALSINLRIKKMDSDQVPAELGKEFTDFFLRYTGKVDPQQLRFLTDTFNQLVEMRVKLIRMRERSTYQSTVEARDKEIINRMALTN